MAFLASSAVGCESSDVEQRAPEPGYGDTPDLETRHLALYFHPELREVNFEELLSASTLDLLDAHVESIADDFDVDVEAEIPVYVGVGWGPEICQGAAGCYFGDGTVYTVWTEIFHELAHAVVGLRGTMPTPFWNEGVAVSYELRRLSGGPYAEVRSNAGAETYRDVDYPKAGHFVRWVAESHGMEAIAELADGKSIAEAFGATEDELFEQYLAGGAWSYDGASTCWGDTARSVGDGVSGVSERDAQDGYVVNYPLPYTTAYYVVDVAEQGTYEFTASSEDPSKIANATLLACVTGTVAEPPPTLILGGVDTTLIDEHLPFFRDDVEERTTIELLPGRYELQVPTGSSRVTWSMGRVSGR